MKKLLLASSMLLMAAPAFAQNVNTNAGLIGVQGTYSTATANKGTVVVGTVAGNYTDVNSTANAKGGSQPYAGSNVTSTAIGGTVSGGTANGKATGTTGGVQGVIFGGTATASASQHNWH